MREATYQRTLLAHMGKCGGDTVLAGEAGGCYARGTMCHVECAKCHEVIEIGKHPGRREYFSGTDAEYMAGTILETEEEP